MVTHGLSVPAQVTFRILVFRPFVGEVIVGRLSDSHSCAPARPALTACSCSPLHCSLEYCGHWRLLRRRVAHRQASALPDTVTACMPVLVGHAVIQGLSSVFSETCMLDADGASRACKLAPDLGISSKTSLSLVES